MTFSGLSLGFGFTVDGIQFRVEGVVFGVYAVDGFGFEYLW